jgi:exonuclease SbcC
VFHSLQYNVTFPGTGRTLSQDLVLEKGFWGITGPNESGKSLIFEMLRFGLFGTAALRGVADDYKTLTMSSSFTIKGEIYTVARTMKKAELKRGDTVIATGVTAVNEKVVQLLGFGIVIFDMACSINQGEVERLGSMTSTERKRMVDGVLGIDALDIVAKWGMEEARLIDKEVEATRRMLVVPVQPTAPVDYVPSSKIDLPSLRADATELATIEGWLSHTRVAPVEPVQAPYVCEADASNRRHLRERVALLEARTLALPATAPFTEAELDAVDWEAYDRYQEARAWLKANPTGTYSIEELEKFLADYVLIEQWNDYNTAAGDIEHLEQMIGKVDHVDCPKCQHHFPLSPDRLKVLQDKLQSMPQPGMPTEPCPPKPPLSVQAVDQEHQRLLGIDYKVRETMEAVPAAPQPAIARERISTYRVMLDQVIARGELQDELVKYQAEFAAMPDYETMLLEWKAYDAALTRYKVESEAYLAWIGEQSEKAMRQSQIADARAKLTAGEISYTTSKAFEDACERFDAALVTYEEAVARITELEEQSSQYRKVRQLMDVLRSLIKQHLMPSLNKVASHLLSGMTGGQRTAIYVDEDFNVVVDSQRLDTLSGSGKAVANLALRIALGQVLTNKVMSVLMADEIDASMDDFRAEQTSLVLCALEKSISQVLLVSHKSLDVENIISLGDVSAINSPLGGTS